MPTRRLRSKRLLEITRREYKDGVLVCETKESRMVYTRRKGTKFVHYMGIPRPITSTSGTLVYEVHSLSKGNSHD